MRLVVMFAAATGARAGEQWALRWRHLDLAGAEGFGPGFNGTLTVADSTLSGNSAGFAGGTSQSVVDAVQGLIAGTDPRVTYADWMADDTFDAMSRVRDIRVPTLAVCGAEDRLTPVKYHEFLAAQIPGCRLTIIEKAGHWMFWEQPDAFTRTVRAFLDSLPPSSRSPAP